MPRVLMVDDMPANLEVLGALLRDQYEVLVATNGQNAIHVATQQKPDHIQLDVH